MENIKYNELRELQEKSWWHSGKREIVLEFAHVFGGLYNDRNSKILDAGCGMGSLLGELDKKAKVQGIDFAEECVDYCKKRGFDVVKGSLPQDIPYADESFDFIFCLDVLEHIQEDELAIQKLFKLLNKGGRCIITVPADERLWSYNDELAHHYRRYNLEDLQNKFEKNGFKVSRITYYNSFLYFPIYITRKTKCKFNINKSDGQMIRKDSILNFLLKRIFVSEKWWLKHVRFPVGVSIIACIEKE